MKRYKKIRNECLVGSRQCSLVKGHSGEHLFMPGGFSDGIWASIKEAKKKLS